MKISNSKKQLAKIINENGGWVSDRVFAAQDKDDYCIWFYYEKPIHYEGRAYWNGAKGCSIIRDELLPNWHRTILSRDEYFHLYPAPDADGWIEWRGGECPVDDGALVQVRFRDDDGSGLVEESASVYVWDHDNRDGDIIAYRLHKPEHVETEYPDGVKPTDPAKVEGGSKPTIEQLAADYRAKLAIAQQAQEEADSHRCGAEAALEKLVAAGKLLGLVLSVAAPEPELVITDWWELQVGDWVWVAEEDHRVVEGEYEVLEVEAPGYDGKRTIRIRGGEGGQFWINYENGWRFIRRPAKESDNA